MFCNQITVLVPLQGWWLAYLLGNDELSNYQPLVRACCLLGLRWIAHSQTDGSHLCNAKRLVGRLCFYPWPRAAGNEDLGRKNNLRMVKSICINKMDFLFRRTGGKELLAAKATEINMLLILSCRVLQDLAWQHRVRKYKASGVGQSWVVISQDTNVSTWHSHG